MNRIASLAAGTITTALVGASIAAVGASQGLLPSGGQSAPETEATWAQSTESLEDEWAGALVANETQTPEATNSPTVIYVDKEPIVVTREIVVRSTGSPGDADSRGLTGEAPAETPSPAPAQPPAVVPGDNGWSANSAPPTLPPSFEPPSPPRATAPQASDSPPPAAAAAPPTSSPVSAESAGSGSSQAGGYDDHGDDRDEEDHEGEEEEHEEEHKKTDEHEDGHD